HGYGTQRAGILDQDVDRSGERRGLRGNGMNVLLLSDIGSDSVRFAAPTANACNRGVQLESISRYQHNARPAVRKLHAQGQPKATTAAGYKNRSILDFHISPLLKNNKAGLLINHQSCQCIGRKISFWRAKFHRVSPCHEYPATPGSTRHDARTDGAFVGRAAPDLGKPRIARSEPYTLGSGQGGGRPSNSSRRIDRTASRHRQAVQSGNIASNPARQGSGAQAL